MIQGHQLNKSTNPTLYSGSLLLSEYRDNYDPYMTCIRLYNRQGEHLATSTFSKPIKKLKTTNQTFKISMIKYK